MARKILLRPEQSASFEMGRLLLVHAGWETKQSKPLNMELGMIIDFVVQSPRLFVQQVPSLHAVIETFGFDKADVGELFAQRRFNTVREKYIENVCGLVAKDLLESSEEFSQSGPTSYRLTASGRQISEKFDSDLGILIIQITRHLADSWANVDIGRLSLEVRKSLPDQSLLAHELLIPFSDWVFNDV